MAFGSCMTHLTQYAAKVYCLFGMRGKGSRTWNVVIAAIASSVACVTAGMNGASASYALPRKAIKKKMYKHIHYWTPWIVSATCAHRLHQWPATTGSYSKHVCDARCAKPRSQ